MLQVEMRLGLERDCFELEISETGFVLRMGRKGF